MGRSRGSYLIPATILSALFCFMAGFEAYPQSQSNATDSGTRIRENTRNAVMTMRMLSSAEVEYRKGSEDREFGTVIDLVRHGLIDADLADALGCPQGTSAKGMACPGIYAPLRGYLYRLEVVRSAADETAQFRIVGFPAVTEGEMQTGAYTFYVDQTQVIRASDNPTAEAGPQSPPLGTPQAPVIR